MKSTIVGFPRIGKDRELKFAIEKYWKGELSEKELLETASGLRKENALMQKNAGLSLVPASDFSFYDLMLDASFMLGLIPAEYKKLGLSSLDTYFAMARGYQGEKGDVKAYTMKKWFNTNYHYMVPQLTEPFDIKFNADFLFSKTDETASVFGKENCVISVHGPFSLLKLAKTSGTQNKADFVKPLTDAYIQILEQCAKRGFSHVQIDEPYLVYDLSKNDIELFTSIYTKILAEKSGTKVLLQTYFGDVRDIYENLLKLDFDAIGLDFVEGKKTRALIEKFGFDKNKVLVAGVVNGKNIWKADYAKILDNIDFAKKYADKVIVSTSCSLLHVPYTLESETALSDDVRKYFSFAKEKLAEIAEVSRLSELDAKARADDKIFAERKALLSSERSGSDKSVQQKVAALSKDDFVRKGACRIERQKIQRKEFNLPLYPTTTIGSFPQTKEVKSNRALFKKGEISKEQYDEKVHEFIKECIKFQEDIGLDILVHGEYERNDMVEFFGENLNGFVFTKKAWVQSYGTRCVKPPVIFGDVSRSKPITVDYSVYSQSLTQKKVKGMLTGPVTILNWSFPREDISLAESTFQIGLAIREEVLDLEKNGINIIQIDEAALREKLPLRREDWQKDYLSWAIDAFRLCAGGVKETTQIHTHMCYSEFEDIVSDIDRMDADVITFEASRSKLSILDSLKQINFETECGPGVYDIHSPRVPSVEEIVDVVKKIAEKLPKEKIWINPDCGLKTRGVPETKASLTNLVEAARICRKTLA